MISTKKYIFELRQHISEINEEIFVYEKGVVIKHIRAKAIVKIQLTDL